MSTRVLPARRRSGFIPFLICLALILIGAIGSYAVQTDGGHINVTGLKIPGPSGAYVSADLFRPTAATPEHKAPLVLVTPGFQRTKETQISYSLELARRGMVVLVVDPYDQGESSSQDPDDPDSALSPAMDLILHSSAFNYVDTSRIGIAGHSAGGSQVRKLAQDYGQAEAKALTAARDPKSDGGEKITKTEQDHAAGLNPVRAVFISGWLQNLTDKSFKDIHSDIGLAYARYDEGGYRNVNKNGDLRHAPEAIAMVNSGLPKSDQVTSVDVGKRYGNLADRSYRIAYNDNTIHSFQPLTPSAIGSMLSFFTTTLDWHTPLAPSNQTWFLKELFSLLGLIGGLGMLVPLARMFLTAPFFRELAKPTPEPQPARRGAVGQTVFWVSFVVTAAVACVTFIPLALATAKVFPHATNSVNTLFFPGRMVNAVLLWAIVNGLLGLAIFFGTWWWYGRRHGVTTDMWGLRLSWREFGKTVLLAALICVTFFTILGGVYLIFHTDFRFLVVAARPVSAKWILVALMYIPLLFIFYFSNSLRVNGSMRFAGQKPWVSHLIAALANSIGLAAIFVIQYVVFFGTGTAYWTGPWLYVNMLQSILPMMIVLPIFNRAFFNATGRVWLGPMVTCVLFTIMSLSASVMYLPAH